MYLSVYRGYCIVGFLGASKGKNVTLRKIYAFNLIIALVLKVTIVGFILKSVIFHENL